VKLETPTLAASATWLMLPASVLFQINPTK
jgi:hypothetical protein